MDAISVFAFHYFGYVRLYFCFNFCSNDLENAVHILALLILSEVISFFFIIQVDPVFAAKG